MAPTQLSGVAHSQSRACPVRGDNRPSARYRPGNLAAHQAERHVLPVPVGSPVVAHDAEPDPDDSEIIAVLRLYTDEMDDSALAAFDREVIRLARVVPPRLAVVATEALAGGDARLRVAGAVALGRCSELAEPGLVTNIETTLIGSAAVATTMF